MHIFLSCPLSRDAIYHLQKPEIPHLGHLVWDEPVRVSESRFWEVR